MEFKYKVMVTGGAGFIGRQLVNVLMEKGMDVTVFDINKPSFGKSGQAPFIEGDITDQDAVEKAIENVDFVFHLAAVMGTSELLRCLKRAVQINIEGTINILEACRKYGVSRIF